MQKNLFPYFFFFWFSIYIDFTRIAASNKASDDIANLDHT